MKMEQITFMAKVQTGQDIFGNPEYSYSAIWSTKGFPTNWTTQEITAQGYDYTQENEKLLIRNDGETENHARVGERILFRGQSYQITAVTSVSVRWIIIGVHKYV